jgi:hypothetical protein
MAALKADKRKSGSAAISARHLLKKAAFCRAALGCVAPFPAKELWA